MAVLSDKHCIPCRDGTGKVQGPEAESLLGQLQEDWKVISDHHLEKTKLFPDFKQALAFVNRVGDLAEKEGHHPDIHLAWGRARILIWTHKVDGLTESDFILASKIDEIY